MNSANFILLCEKLYVCWFEKLRLFIFEKCTHVLYYQRYIDIGWRNKSGMSKKNIRSTCTSLHKIISTS